MTPDGSKNRDITSTTLQIIFIGLLIAAGFWTIHPFLTPLVWSVIIVDATWPAMLKVQAICRGKRWPAVTVMTIGLLMLLVVPLYVAITSIVGRSDEIATQIKSLSTMTIAPPPHWIDDIPVLGPRIAAGWNNLAAESSQELTAKLVPYTDKIVAWFVSKAGSIGIMILNFLLTVIIAAILYAKGETAASGAYRLAGRLAGRQGVNTVELAAKAVRGVALGVVLTALIQSVIGGIGLAITGMPALMLLTGIMFLLCIAQIGPGLVLVPSIIWLYWSGGTLSGTILVAFALVACTIDNFIRPVLIRKGADLPLVLIFAGVIGGLIAFGIIGLFIGPVVLAVIFTLLKAWVGESGPEKEPPPADTRNHD